MLRFAVTGAALAFMLALAVHLAAGARSSPAEAGEPAPAARMALDADPGAASIQDSVAIPGAGPFTVTVHMVEVSQPYVAFQWKISFTNSDLQFMDNIVTHTAGAGLDFCVETGSVEGATTTVSGACLSLTDVETDYTGPLASFDMGCLRDGVFTLELVPVSEDPNFGSGPLVEDALGDFVFLPTATQDITVYCGVTPPTPTATPVPPMPTPAPPTPTATRVPECMNVGQKIALAVGIVMRFGAEEGDRDYKRRYDLNADGVIDDEDLAAVIDAPLCNAQPRGGRR